MELTYRVIFLMIGIMTRVECFEAEELVFGQTTQLKVDGEAFLKVKLAAEYCKEQVLMISNYLRS
jgi:hypothetical protein